MSVPVCDVPTPRIVPSCIVKNNSDEHVKIQILFEGRVPQGEGIHHEISNADIPAGETYRTEERIVDHGMYRSRKTIESVEVTRTDGRTHKLTAPFDGVFTIELDWPFIIDNEQVHSGKRDT